ncbi:MAG: preprotein translocase subunit SecG [Myxococcales bacterium FL481]|nr:MAG: preprotein translocase subunit SecG [Myxococcales bacterium FL481]
MTIVITIIYVLVCIFMVLVILLQAGRGGGMGTALGGGASQSVFGGGGGADFMAKLTQGCAAAFVLCAMYLAYESAHSGSEFLKGKSQELAAEKNLADDEGEINYERLGRNPLPLPGADTPPEPSNPAQATSAQDENQPPGNKTASGEPAEPAADTASADEALRPTTGADADKALPVADPPTPPSKPAPTGADARAKDDDAEPGRGTEGGGSPGSAGSREDRSTTVAPRPPASPPSNGAATTVAPRPPASPPSNDAATQRPAPAETKQPE